MNLFKEKKSYVEENFLWIYDHYEIELNFLIHQILFDEDQDVELVMLMMKKVLVLSH